MIERIYSLSYMETYQININNQTIEYDIIFKHMKSIHLKVVNGKLLIKAPFHTPLSLIEKNIHKYQHKLLPQIQAYEPYYDYRHQGYVDIFSSRYLLDVRDVGRRKCEIHGDALYVYHRSIDKCVESYLKTLLLNYIEERVIYYLAYDFDLGMPRIEVRKYKGRWGSCFYKENKISFNLSLVHLDKELIDYVIVHELTHFLQANHSSLFYQEMQKRMPDYKQRQKKLKEQHV
ncbi:MAG: YgjP-like metallopeptidase domain-containing protein [Coprobacillus sp.]